MLHSLNTLHVAYNTAAYCTPCWLYFYEFMSYTSYSDKINNQPIVGGAPRTKAVNRRAVG